MPQQVLGAVPLLCVALAAPWALTTLGGPAPRHSNPAPVTIPSTVVYGIDLEGSGAAQRTLFVYKVTAAPGEVISAFHLSPLPGSRVVLKGVPRATPLWTASSKGGRWSWQAAGVGLTGGQSAVFTVEAGAGFRSEDLKWVTSRPTSGDPTSSETDSGPRFSDSDQTLRGPAITIDLTAGAPRIGSTMEVKVKAPLPGYRYVVHCLSAQPPAFSAHEEFASFVLKHPAPADWGLSMNDLSGVIAASETGTGSIAIPENPALVGLDLWLVAELINPADPDERYQALPLKLSFAE